MGCLGKCIDTLNGTMVTLLIQLNKFVKFLMKHENIFIKLLLLIEGPQGLGAEQCNYYLSKHSYEASIKVNQLVQT